MHKTYMTSHAWPFFAVLTALQSTSPIHICQSNKTCGLTSQAGKPGLGFHWVKF